MVSDFKLLFLIDVFRMGHFVLATFITVYLQWCKHENMAFLFDLPADKIATWAK